MNSHSTLTDSTALEIDAERDTPATSRAFAPSLAAVAFSVVVYALWPDARHAALALLCLTLACGSFTLAPAEVVKVGVGAVALLASAVATLWAVAPGGFEGLTDGLDALMVGLALPVLSHTAHQFSHKRLRLADQQGSLAQALARLEMLATRDPLTSLFNARHMAELMTQQARRAQRADAPLSVALLDLDHFKQVNDRHGPELGDAVLADVARRATDALRQTDVVGRWSGQSFMVLFVDSDPAQAALGLERLRERLAQPGLGAHTGHPGVTVQFSAGLAEWTPGEALQRTVQRLDEALRQAKADGRDRVVRAAVLPQAADVIASPATNAVASA